MLKRIYALIIIGISLCSCIRNDIPYPRIQCNFLSMTAAEQSKAATIDSTKRIVTLHFPEETNIYEVKIDTFAITPGASVVDDALVPGQVIDLSKEFVVSLQLYQDYQWSIVSEQPIDRSFVLEGQIGTSVIDVPAQRVLATVDSKISLSSIYVETCKLGPSTATTTPDIQGKSVDFSQPVVLNLENYGHIQKWTIYVTQAEKSVETVRVDAWTKVAWVYGEAQAGKANTVQYRLKGDTEWLQVPDSWLTIDGGDFCARLSGLSPTTTYEARAVSGEDYANVIEFTTGEIVQLPNSSFEDWWLDGKVWCPWAENGTPYWDTGNKGAATLGQSNTTPTDDTVSGSGKAARLETKFVGIGMLGKLAAGNIFVGKYVRTDGTNGVLSFGRDFTQYPTHLRGYMKYQTAPISSVSSGFEDLKGRPDTCIVWCALIDSDEPFEIRTNPNNRQLFDPEGDYVIAYGKCESGSDIPAYAPFDVELKYYSTYRKPKYILVTCSASKYGDYFTGGNGAVLYLDDFELTYE